MDLSAFSFGEQLPGTYRVDVFLNQELVDTRNVTFVQGNQRLLPTLSVADLKAMGVNIPAFPELAQLAQDADVTELMKYIPQADSTFDFNHQRLDISMPQAALNFKARNAVDPSQWDQGLPAFLMNYNASGANDWLRNGEGSGSSAYLNLGTGLNLGAWRLRNNSVYSSNRNSSQRTDENGDRQTSTSTRQGWQSINTYAQRDIQHLQGQLTLGEAMTANDVFDGIPFRGVQLASDDSMLPDSLRGFAPVVRGIASSNAQVTVRQNGYIIYQSYVAPGAFALQDLYPTSSSGDFTVTVRESDGSESSFIQPFSAVPIMQREGHWRYAISGGEYRSTMSEAQKPTFLQSSLVYGVSNSLTLYGGTQLSGHYQSILAGIGQGMGHFGSLSIDATQAKTTLRNDHIHQGQSYRMQYAKDVFQSGTTFTLAGYRYSTEEFYDFQEANEIDATDANNWRQLYNRRSKVQLQVNQSLSEFGNLYFNAYQQDYWQLPRKERTLNVGYNVNVNGVSYGLNYSETKSPLSRNNQYLAFNVQVPLSKWLNNSWATYNIQNDNRGKTRQQVGMNGLALEGNNLNYAVNESYSNQGEGNAGSVSATYKGSAAQVTAGYNYTQNNRQVNYGIQGGVLVHPYGVTLAQSMGDSVALIRAPDAGNVRVQNQTGVYTDSKGYAVVPFVNTYRKNSIALDTGTLGDKVDLDGAVKTVVPTAGAVVLADFKTQVGARAFITLTYRGKPIPFGATASLTGAGKSSTGIVGDAGSVYLAGIPASGQLEVKWGPALDQRCLADFSVPAAHTAPVISLAVICQ
ncbi:fimbria/pilus outer membrane usher protein [Serratia liquefaciens]|uniref:fimbria/pilus outer membrane usher protein n=1 Tax=Serratia liquefaciens TaxID=614 RepID=UPI0021CEED19|nr:fimbria/pilus outer membrane usher protein [Serratia liquefaciens]